MSADAAADLRPDLNTVRRAAVRFGADPDTLHLVNAGVNTVYRAGRFALRLTSEARKDREYLTPPLHWLRHLHAAGASVCEPLAGTDGSWIAALEEGPKLYLATAVRWVERPRLSDLPPTPELHLEYGRSIGSLHRASSGFALTPGARHMLEPGESGVFARWDWLWQRAAGSISGVPILERAFERLTPDVLTWAAEEAVMTHGDLRPGNVIWDAEHGRAVVIDFDEPVLGPTALDLAHAGLELGSAERPALMVALLAGYRAEHPLHPVWDERLPRLMAARAALMVAWSVADADGSFGPDSGSGAVVSVPRLLERLEQDDF